ncbi:endonuclease/exonuclease/phosphatase family protein [Rhizoctonia solani AG-3 Rhs1AP]|uniref:Endonuclease/exonuclease/phosphatase family protein n=1 Tax=Rhizoctonia solani AG-3 Rhs1AP TaxID=1086054 RepID=A0A0A1UIL3_9AGAM|nr:endonuclease/exonuclease/phosphatase family protein [Rhizoctonia solani AG-3 Rhs1AP]
MRVRIYEGVYIDMINLDTEVAGTLPVDPNVRLWNIQQVADFIDANSAGNAVIVVGNTHSLYTGFMDNIRLFTINNGLTDAWVQAIGGNAPASGADVIVCPPGVPSNIGCEGIDKVFYRGSPIIDLSSSGFFYDTSRFLTPKGVPLFKRNPIRVEFVYTLKSGLRQSDLCGGPHGTWFNDLPSIPPSPKLSSITFRGGRRLDGLTLTLASGQTFIHGGWGGNPYSLALTPGEYITSVKLCWGKRHGHTRNFYAEATTNKGQSLRAGKMTNDCATATAPIGYGVVGTYGQAGDEMDQLGFIYAEQASSAEPF